MKLLVIIFLSVFLWCTVEAQNDGHIYNLEPGVEKLLEKSDKAFNKGNPEKAITYLEQAKGKAPGNVQVLDKLAGTYYDENRKLDAKNLYAEIEERINAAISNDTTLTQPILDELQVTLDLALKRHKELLEEWPDEPESLSADDGGEEEIPEVLMSFDKIDPNIEKNFLTNPKPLNEDDPYPTQVDRVKDEVMEQFAKIEDKGNWYNNDFSKILEINNDWLKHSAISKIDWFSGLKAKEKEYLESLNDYESLRQEKERLLNKRTIILDEISNIDLKTRWENEKRMELQGKVQTQLKEELKGKLSAIPKSIVLVGRTKFSDDRGGMTMQEARAARNQTLMEDMQQEAIRLVGGQKIDMYSSMTDNELKQFFSTTSEGTAQTIDNYYKDLILEFKEQGKFAYLISRIEVFPLDNSGGTSAIRNGDSGGNVFKQTNQNTTVFRWVQDEGLLENCSNSRDRKPFHDHKFKVQEKNYLDFQTRFSKSLNDRYKSEIEKAGREYDESVKKTNLLIDMSLKEIMSFNSQTAALQDTLQIVEKRLLDMDQEIEQHKISAQRLSREYQIYYRSKNSQVNKLVIESSMGTDYTAKEMFSNMVDKTLSGLEDIRKKSQSLVVYKEVSNEGESIKASEYTVEFEPVLRRYRILSMGKFEDEDGDIFYSINIAYDVGWKPISEGQENISPVAGPLPSVIAHADPKSNQSPTMGEMVDFGDLTFRGDGSVSIVLAGRRMDILIVPDASSKVSFLYSDLPNEWRLPTLPEMQNIFKLASINKGTSDDFIAKKFKWQESWAAFLTSETITNYQNESTNTCVELSRMDYSTRKDELLDDEEVYLLLIRK